MPAQIDWKAEDEQSWGAIEPEEKPAAGRRTGRRRRNILLVLVVVAGLVALIITQLNHLLQNNTQRLEEQLKAEHELVMDAALGGDGDLLRQLTVDRLPEWSDAEVQLAESGLWLDRSPLGLYLVAEDDPPATELDLDPSLNEAVVTMTVSYGLGVSEAAQEAIHLQQSYIYRYEDERWLLSPPTGEYWGARLSSGGRYLALSYPARDAEIGRRLAADLEAILGQACHSVELLNCEPGSRLVVDLVADPAMLVELADPAWQLYGGRDIRLPTPSVIGLPRDEAAYRALYQAYARQVVSRLISEQTALVGTDQPLIALSIMDVILRQMRLRSTTYSPILMDARGVAVVAALERIWNRHPPLEETLNGGDGQIARAVAAFLESTWSETPETEMLRALKGSANAQEWLQGLAPDFGDRDFAEAWDRAKAAAEAKVIGQEWPDEVVLLMCDQGVVGSASLYQYDPLKEFYSRLLGGREFIYLEPMPGDAGVLLTEQLIRRDGQRTFLWHDGRLTPYDGPGEQPAASGSAEQPPALLAPSGHNRTRAVSNDGRWLATLKGGALVLSTMDQSFSRAVPQVGRECRGLAWVQATGAGGQG